MADCQPHPRTHARRMRSIPSSLALASAVSRPITFVVLLPV